MLARCWTDEFKEGRNRVFVGALNQGEFLQVGAGEMGTLIHVERGTETEPGMVSLKLWQPHWQLGEGNVLHFDESCRDVLNALGAP